MYAAGLRESGTKLFLGNSRSGKAERKVSPADLRSECLPETDNLGFDVMV